MTTKKHRIVILAEGKFAPLSAKTANGVIRYSRHETVAVIDSHQAGKTVQDVLGYGGNIPIISSVAEAMQFEPDIFLIGIAPTGGQLPQSFRHFVRDAIEQRLEVWNGMHSFVGDDKEFSELAAKNGVRIWDVRRPRQGLVVADGSALHAKAFVVLMIGSDCNVGKMTTALELQKLARERGYKAGFVATGQTGILIEGDGTPLDAIPGDFMSGEVERLVMQCDADRDDVIFVEGQGSLLHPGFGPVTLGLVLGSMADAYILCHQPSRTTYRPGYDIELPPLPEVIRGYEDLVRVYKAPKTLALALNTFDLNDEQAEEQKRKLAAETGLPTADPIRHGVTELFDAIEPALKAKIAHRVSSIHIG